MFHKHYIKNTLIANAKIHIIFNTKQEKSIHIANYFIEKTLRKATRSVLFDRGVIV